MEIWNDTQIEGVWDLGFHSRYAAGLQQPDPSIGLKDSRGTIRYVIWDSGGVAALRYRYSKKHLPHSRVR